MIQLALFDDNYTTHYIQQDFTFKFPQISGVTFLNGLSEPVHRWFRLTPSYSPELVRFFVKELEMAEHIRELDKITTANFRGTYVVGNSRLKDVEILTDVLLAKIFDIEGFNVDQLLVLRKRGGKKELYETAICVSK